MFALFAAVALATEFTPVADGVELAELTLPASSHGDGRLHVVRIDPARATLVVRTASRDGEPRSVRAWAEEGQLVAAINAGMFLPDHRTNTGLLVDGDHINQPALSADKAFLGFGPRDEALPAARIADRGCDDVDALRPRYATWIQGIRMVSCTGANVWSQQPRKWSHAAIGEDGDGRILFLHARSPYSTHDFIDHLLATDLGLVNLQYAEGGPEAQLVVREPGRTRVWVGSYETGFYESDANTAEWAVPNAIGVRAAPLQKGGPVDPGPGGPPTGR